MPHCQNKKIIETEGVRVMM